MSGSSQMEVSGTYVDVSEYSVVQGRAKKDSQSKFTPTLPKNSINEIDGRPQ